MELRSFEKVMNVDASKLGGERDFFFSVLRGSRTSKYNVTVPE